MSDRVRLAWVLMAFLFLSPAGRGQTPSAAAPTNKVSTLEWGRLRDLAASLCTEDGARALFIRSPKLAESFTSNDHFVDFVAPWRSRLTPLPLSPLEPSNVELEVSRGDEGTTVYRLTYHHERPSNAITIMKTVWQGETLVKLVFMKGFSSIDYDNAGKSRRTRWDSRR